MRYFFDTEFLEDGRTIDLISIGIVAEDGREYYADAYGAHARAAATPWLTENVLPHLGHRHDVKSTNVIAQDIVEFVGDAPEFWAYFADYDWVVLCQLFGRMIDLPKGWPMYCRDLKQHMDLCGISRGDLPKQEGAEHNALADARWVRDGFDYVQENAIWECRY